MTHSIYLCIFNPPIKNTKAELEEIKQRLDCLEDMVTAYAVHDGQLLVQGQDGIAQILSGALSTQRFPIVTRTVVELIDEYRAHEGLPKAILNLFFPPDGGELPPALLQSIAKAVSGPAPSTLPEYNLDPLAQFVGMDTVIEQFRSIAASIVENRRANELFDTLIPEGFHNILLMGQQGVGKTSLARACADALKQKGVIAHDAPVELIAANDSLEGYIGQSEVKLRAKLDTIKKGVLIIDELDTLLQSSSFGKALINTLNTYMGNFRNTPIVIATLYSSNYEDVMRVNKGLAGRFAHKFQLPTYSDDLLVKILASKIHHAGLLIEKSALDEAKVLFGQVRKVKHDLFSNAREAEEIMDAALIQRNVRHAAQRITPDTIINHRCGTAEREQLTREYLTIRVEDIPVFNTDLRCFVAQPARTPEAPQRAATTDGNVHHFQPKQGS